MAQVIRVASLAGKWEKTHPPPGAVNADQFLSSFQSQPARRPLTWKGPRKGSRCSLRPCVWLSVFVRGRVGEGGASCKTLQCTGARLPGGGGGV